MSNKARKWILAGAVVLLAVMLLACIKVGEKEPEVTPVPPTPTPVPPTPTPVPPTPTPVPEAKPEIVAVRLCRGLTDDGRPFAETNTYSEIDPFAVSVEVSDMKPGNVVAAHWYMDDSQIGLTEKDNIAGSAFVGMLLEPQGSWIPGNYRLEVSLDGEVKEGQDFAVIGIAKPVDAGGGGKAGGDTGGGEVEWAGYSSTELGFALQYPSGWEVEEADSAVQFTHPQETGVALVLVDGNPSSSAEQEAEKVFAVISEKLPNVQMTTSKAQEGGWHGVFFGYNKGGTDILGVLLSKVVGSRGYNMMFVGVKEGWKTVVPLFQQMWASFQTAEEAGAGGAAGGEVLIVGVIIDGDTGRGIPNAVFVILKEGVTIKQFTDSGNDKSLIYDAAQSGEDGSFKMNLPIKRGVSHAVFAVAKGYKPVVDTVTLPESAPEVWKVRVGMQKE